MTASYPPVPRNSSRCTSLEPQRVVCVRVTCKRKAVARHAWTRVHVTDNAAKHSNHRLSPQSSDVVYLLFTTSFLFHSNVSQVSAVASGANSPSTSSRGPLNLMPTKPKTRSIIRVQGLERHGHCAQPATRSPGRRMLRVRRDVVGVAAGAAEACGGQEVSFLLGV